MKDNHIPTNSVLIQWICCLDFYPKLLNLFVGLIEVRKEKYKFYQIEKENNVAEAERENQQTVTLSWTCTV